MHLKICQIELRWPDWTLLRLMSSALPTAVIGPGSQNENALILQLFIKERSKQLSSTETETF